MSGMPKAARQQRVPVDVVFAVRDARGFLQGADVSSHLRILNMVEYSYYLGLPVLQIAERKFTYIITQKHANDPLCTVWAHSQRKQRSFER